MQLIRSLISMNRFHPQKWERSWEPTEQPAHVPDLWWGRLSSECLSAERVRWLLRHDRPGRLRLPSDRRWIFVLNREKLIIVWSSFDHRLQRNFRGAFPNTFPGITKLSNFVKPVQLACCSIDLFNWFVQLACPIGLLFNLRSSEASSGRTARHSTRIVLNQRISL